MKKLKINAQALLAALSRAPYIAKDKILSMALLELFDGKVTLTSMDHSATMIQHVDYDSGNINPVALDIVLLSGVLQNMTGRITLNQKDNKISLTSGKRRFNIPCIPGEHFPSLPDLTIKPFKANMSDLLNGLRHVFYAAGKHDVRLFLNGICLQRDNMVATDGHRIAVYPFECDMPDDQGVIIPRDSVQLIQKHVRPDCSAHLIYTNNSSNVNMLAFKSSSFQLYCKLIDLKYPEWRSKTPNCNEQEHHISIDKPEMQAALQRLSLFEGLFDISKTSTGISLSSKDAEDDLHAEVESNEDFTVSMSNRYFSDALSLCGDDDKITLHGSGPYQIWMLTIKGKPETHYMLPFKR